MSDTNKIKYGIKNVYYSVVTEDPSTLECTYATPVKFPGARSISLSAVGETTKFAADDVTYWQGVSNSGYEGDLVMAKIIDSFHTAVLGEVADTNGVIAEYNDMLGQPFALLFEFEGDKTGTRHVLYNCVASRPNIAGQTVDGTISPEEETVSITASPRAIDGLVKAKLTGDSTDTHYDDWFDAVYVPTKPQ